MQAFDIVAPHPGQIDMVRLYMYSIPWSVDPFTMLEQIDQQMEWPSRDPERSLSAAVSGVAKSQRYARLSFHQWSGRFVAIAHARLHDELR